MNNPIIQDIRDYRNDRLTMANPKGYGHVLRVFEHYNFGNRYVGLGFAQAEVDQAYTVLQRLARLYP